MSCRSRAKRLRSFSTASAAFSSLGLQRARLRVITERASRRSRTAPRSTANVRAERRSQPGRARRAEQLVDDHERRGDHRQPTGAGKSITADDRRGRPRWRCPSWPTQQRPSASAERDQQPEVRATSARASRLRRPGARGRGAEPRPQPRGRPPRTPASRRCRGRPRSCRGGATPSTRGRRGRTARPRRQTGPARTAVSATGSAAWAPATELTAVTLARDARSDARRVLAHPPRGAGDEDRRTRRPR